MRHTSITLRFYVSLSLVRRISSLRHVTYICVSSNCRSDPFVHTSCKQKFHNSDKILPAGNFGLDSIVPLPWLKTCATHIHILIGNTMLLALCRLSVSRVQRPFQFYTVIFLFLCVLYTERTERTLVGGLGVARPFSSWYPKERT
jgi:hypothetical protein